MTRAERLAEDLRRREERLRQERLKASETRRAIRGEQEKDRARRRKCVGLLADESGLFVWDNGTLGLLFAQLARLKETPDPVAVLEALLGDVEAEILVEK
jgi:hypothetical protein